jgi:hypothetical protein
MTSITVLLMQSKCNSYLKSDYHFLCAHSSLSYSNLYFIRPHSHSLSLSVCPAFLLFFFRAIVWDSVPRSKIFTKSHTLRME